MDDEQKGELKALVVGFFIQSLKEYPSGLSISQFERIFPERCDEEADWYKRYQKRNALEALKCIPDAVRINQSGGNYFITLNQQCKEVDHDLVDLVVNQRASNKKRRGRPNNSYQRALSSFSLNRQYAPTQYNRSYSHRSTRLNQDHKYNGESLYAPKKSPPPTFRPSIYSQSSHTHNIAHGDPRNRDHSSSPMVPPQVKLSSISRPASQTSASKQPVSKSSDTPSKSSHEPLKAASRPATATIPEKKDDPVTTQKKSYMRQKIVSLLTRKYAEIKIIYLNTLYHMEYEENIDPKAFGYSSLTLLLEDPEFKPYIQVKYGTPYSTIVARTRPSNGKENIGSSASNINSQTNSTRETETKSSSNKSNTISKAKIKLDAIDLFNIRSMMESLEPISGIKPLNLNTLPVDEAVKYKTLRIIFKSPDSTLKIEEWSVKFQQESRLKIRIQDYGFKTMLEFFKSIAKELPIKVCLNQNDDWVAIADIELLSSWMHEKLVEGSYKAITAIEAKYELIAFPNDTYTFTEVKELIGREYQPAFILAIKSFNDMWIQLRVPKKIEEHLCVEASMTCYEDYKAQDLLAVPKYFIKPGFPCAAYETKEQKRWCRALILKAPEIITRNEFVTVLLVDYGFVRKYAITQLSCLMKSHLKLPVGPIYSRLHGIQESKNTSDEQDKVNRKAKRTLHEYTSPPVTLACKFMSAKPTESPAYLPKFCYEVSLVDTRQGRDHNLADDINLPDEV